MNLLAQFWRYAHKVYDLPRRLRAVRDTRPYPVIETAAVTATLFLGALLRVPSFLRLASETRRPGWRRLVGLRAPVSEEVFNYVSERHRLEDLRAVLVATNRTLKQNKAFESAKLHGLLVVAIDGNEQFHSRWRCCPECSRRRVKEKDARTGQEREVVEYYHRQVYAQLHGPDGSVILDLEPIRPGEEEAQAALRMLGRMRRLYGPRFFDVVTVDAWYATEPFVRAVRHLGWGVVSVLKQERYTVYQEASVLARRQAPIRWQWEQRQIQLREVRDLSLTEARTQTVRVVLADERWTQRHRVAGRTVSEAKTSHWRWIVTPELDAYPVQAIWRLGHQRWGVENHAFNELTQYYHLTHCPHHEPVAILAWLLILVLAFNLFEVFIRLHSKLWRQGTLTLQELARRLDRALEHPGELQPLWSG